jgi:hypothetical protein
VLAGTWTATGWPATLESAVISGHAAAAQALQRLGIEEPDARTRIPAAALGISHPGESPGVLAR